jgi:hypothetical protein
MKKALIAFTGCAFLCLTARAALLPSPFNDQRRGLTLGFGLGPGFTYAPLPDDNGSSPAAWFSVAMPPGFQLGYAPSNYLEFHMGILALVYDFKGLGHDYASITRFFTQTLGVILIVCSDCVPRSSPGPRTRPHRVGCDLLLGPGSSFTVPRGGLWPDAFLGSSPHRPQRCCRVEFTRHQSIRLGLMWSGSVSSSAPTLVSTSLTWNLTGY